MPETERVNLQLVNPQILSVRSSRRPVENAHLTWEVGIAPDLEENVTGRIVFGTLHAFDSSGGGTITVAAVVLQPHGSPLDLDSFENAVDQSEALETLYDFARGTLRVVHAMVDSSVELPTKAPDPEFSLLTRVSHEHEAGDEEE